MVKEENSAELSWLNAKQRDIHRYYPRMYEGAKFDIQEPILDIGGGAGTFLKFLKIPKATIVDVGGKNSLVGDYKFIRADITKELPVKGKFKTIFIMETLEHIRNPLYLMSKVYDILDENGKCYIAVPYTKLNLQSTDRFNSHVCRWKYKELGSQLSKTGFRVRFIKKQRRFKNMAFWLPHCFLVAELTKRLNN